MDTKKKLVALGDSILKGVLFTKEENGHVHYSLSDHNIVDRVASKLHSDVLNLGKMGCTIDVGERILHRYQDRLQEAKYVIMCYGGNDSDYNWRAIADNPFGEHQAKTTIGVFEKTYARMIQKLREIGCTPLILSLPAMDTQQYFEYLTSAFNDDQKKNVLRWLHGSVDTIWAGHELYNDAIKRIAQTTNTQLIDITVPLQKDKVYLCADGIHPNMQGQAAIADIINRNLINHN